jgi:hypothetical protein
MRKVLLPLYIILAPIAIVVAYNLVRPEKRWP